MKPVNYLIVFLFFFVNGCDKPGEPIKDKVDEFNYIFNAIQEYYPFTDYKDIDLGKLYAEFEPLIKNAPESELGDIYVNLLAELKDGHANVYSNSGLPIYGYKIPRREKDIESFNIELIKDYLSKDFKDLNGLFKYEILPDNIGYVYYSSFSGNIDEYKNFDLILDYFKNTKGLIIDIRNNGGGIYPQETYYPEGTIYKTDSSVD